MTAAQHTRPGRVGRPLALGAVLGLGLLLAPADPGASAAPPQPGPYEQTSKCISDSTITLDPLADAVSAPQRALGYTSLWSLSRGAGVTIAVIDTGVRPGPAFGDRLVPGGDLIDTGVDTGGLLDCDGHGTLVAGLIAGAPDAASGYAGVAPEARILTIRQNSIHYKLRTDDAATTAGDSTTLAEAVDRAVDEGADVVNISAADCGPAASTNDATLTAAVERAVRRNVVVVVAAGNLGEAQGCSTQNTPGQAPVTGATPANIDAALTVGSVTASGAAADFSLAGPWVDVAAPGDDVVSTNPHENGAGQVDRIATTNGLSRIQGTSFSAAYVSGVVALVRSRFPDLTAEQVMHRIRATADHPAGAGERNIAVGYGVVDPRMALTAVLPEEEGASPPQAAPRSEELSAGRGGDTQAAARRVALLGAGGVLVALLAVLGAVAVRRRGPHHASGPDAPAAP